MGVLGKQIGKRLSKVLSAKQTPLSRNQQMVEPATEAQIDTFKAVQLELELEH
jgi:hypothetical protein